MTTKGKIKIEFMAFCTYKHCKLIDIRCNRVEMIYKYHASKYIIDVTSSTMIDTFSAKVNHASSSKYMLNTALINCNLEMSFAIFD